MALTDEEAVQLMSDFTDKQAALIYQSFKDLNKGLEELHSKVCLDPSPGCLGIFSKLVRAEIAITTKELKRAEDAHTHIHM